MVCFLIFHGLDASRIVWLKGTKKLRAPLLVRGGLDWVELPCPSHKATFLLRIFMASHPLLRRFSVRKCRALFSFCPISHLSDLEKWVSSPCRTNLPLGGWCSYSSCLDLCRPNWLSSLDLDLFRLGWPWTERGTCFPRWEGPKACALGFGWDHPFCSLTNISIRLRCKVCLS